MALNYFGFHSFESVGGISGGAVPLRFYAAGVTVPEMIDLAINLDFGSLLDQEATMTGVMVDHYYRSGSRYKDQLPTKGKYNGLRFAKWIESVAGGGWPTKLNFWTMAVDKEAQILLTHQGVFNRQEGGTFTQISTTTPPLGRSIFASCTVPGYFTPVDLTLDNGEKLTLHDGAWSWEGMRPITLVEEHYHARPGDIILCDVGPDPSTYEWVLTSIWKLICGSRCVPPLGQKAVAENEVLLIKPVVTSIGTFEFTAHSDKKWQAIMEGFAATAHALNKAYRLTEDQYLKGRDIVVAFNQLVLQSRKAPAGILSTRTAALLKAKGAL
jgi:predicted acylesterase/phospholipase RssA